MPLMLLKTTPFLNFQYCRLRESDLECQPLRGIDDRAKWKTASRNQDSRTPAGQPGEGVSEPVDPDLSSG